MIDVLAASVVIWAFLSFLSLLLLFKFRSSSLCRFLLACAITFVFSSLTLAGIRGISTGG
jgi:hypothetical protein